MSPSDFYQEVVAWLPPQTPKPPANVVLDLQEFGTTPEAVAEQWLEHLKSPQ